MKRIHLPMQEMQETWVPSLGQEDPLEEEMVIHSSILAWKIPRTEEPGELQSVESQKSQITTECTRTCFEGSYLHQLQLSQQVMEFTIDQVIDEEILP